MEHTRRQDTTSYRMAESLLGNFAGHWGQGLQPPEALRLAQTCRAAHALRSELLLSVSPAWRSRREEICARRAVTRSGSEGRLAWLVLPADFADSVEDFDPAPVVNGLQFCALGAYYRRTTPERDALLLLDLDRAPHLPNGWARRVLGNEALHLAVEYGHPRVLRWLRGAYGLDGTDARFRICIDIRRVGLLRGLILLGRVYSLRSLDETPSVGKNLEALLAEFLFAACGEKGCTAADRRVARYLAFREGCALCEAAASGHAECARILFGAYELGAADALAPAGGGRGPGSRRPAWHPFEEALGTAIREEGGLDVLLAFWEGAGLTPDDVLGSVWVDVLYRGAGAGRLSLLKWVAATCRTPDRVRGNAGRIAAEAARCGHPAVLQWLHAYLQEQQPTRRFPWKTTRLYSAGSPHVWAWINEAAGSSSSEDEHTNEDSSSGADDGRAF